MKNELYQAVYEAVAKNNSKTELSYEIDKLVAYSLTGEFGKRARIALSYAKLDENNIEPHDKFSYVCFDKGMFAAEERIMTITYVRSGIVFYVDDKDDTERSFPLGSVFAGRLEKYEYVSDLNPELFEAVPNFSITKVSYAKDYERPLPKFVKVLDNCLRLTNANKYYRDGGQYYVEYEYNAESKLVVKASANMPSNVVGLELIEVTEKEWRKSNGEYTPELKYE